MASPQRFGDDFAPLPPAALDDFLDGVSREEELLFTEVWQKYATSKFARLVEAKSVKSNLVGNAAFEDAMHEEAELIAATEAVLKIHELKGEVKPREALRIYKMRGLI